jgi:glycosyltransferase involved in cell wall biosynthesis
VRVLHLHRIGGIGGSERHLLELLPALRSRNVDARFLGLDDVGAAPEPFYRALDDRGVPFARLPSPGDVHPRLVARAQRAVGAFAPDLVHTHLVHADVYGALAVGGTRTSLVSTKHNDDPFRSGRLRYLERLLTRRAARVVCITEALASFNREVVGLPAEKVRVVYYGLDAPPEAWGPQSGPELPDETRILLAVCRLVRQKGLDVALQAVARIRGEHQDLHLVVLGEGPLREELRALARQLGVADAVSFPGRVGDVAWWYRRASIVVHPVRWEGFGLALLEAMLCERPIVASAVSSVPEIVADGETGLLVPPEEPAALAHAISELLSDPAQAERMGEAGRTRAQREFPWPG